MEQNKKFLFIKRNYTEIVKQLNTLNCIEDLLIIIEILALRPKFIKRYDPIDGFSHYLIECPQGSIGYTTSGIIYVIEKGDIKYISTDGIIDKPMKKRMLELLGIYTEIEIRQKIFTKFGYSYFSNRYRSSKNLIGFLKEIDHNHLLIEKIIVDEGDFTKVTVLARDRGNNISTLVFNNSEEEIRKLSDIAKVDLTVKPYCNIDPDAHYYNKHTDIVIVRDEILIDAINEYLDNKDYF